MKFIKHENTWCWGQSTIIITNDGCGTVTVQFEDDADFAIICGLSVYKEKRNKGYGTQLLKEAEAEAAKHKRKYIYLGTDENTWVYNWYIRQGYVDDGYDYSYNKVKRLRKTIK